jgi:hypothetical protein
MKLEKYRYSYITTGIIKTPWIDALRARNLIKSIRGVFTNFCLMVLIIVLRLFLLISLPLSIGIMARLDYKLRVTRLRNIFQSFRVDGKHDAFYDHPYVEIKCYMKNNTEHYGIIDDK